ncbi:hypothetical protein C3R44_23540, partial [Mycobacterium tuberculosis]
RARHEDPHTRSEPGPVTAHREREHPRPGGGEEAREAAGGRRRTHAAEHRQREGATVGRNAQRTRGERHASGGAARRREAREAQALA